MQAFTINTPLITRAEPRDEKKEYKPEWEL